MAGTLRGFVALDPATCDRRRAGRPRGADRGGAAQPAGARAGRAAGAAGDGPARRRRLGHRGGAARPGRHRRRQQRPSLLFSRRQTLARYAAALLAARPARAGAGLGAAGGRRAGRGRAQPGDRRARCWPRRWPPATRRRRRWPAPTEAVRLAYSTEQRSERAAADALPRPVCRPAERRAPAVFRRFRRCASAVTG